MLSSRCVNKRAVTDNRCGLALGYKLYTAKKIRFAIITCSLYKLLQYFTNIICLLLIANLQLNIAVTFNCQLGTIAFPFLMPFLAYQFAEKILTLSVFLVAHLHYSRKCVYRNSSLRKK